MTIDRLTTRLRDALTAGHALAEEHRHGALEPAHVLAALLNPPDPGTRSLLGQAGVDPERLRKAMSSWLDAQPQVSGDHAIQGSPSLSRSLNRADRLAQKAGDAFVPVEWWLRSCLDDGEAGRLLKDAGAKEDALEAAIAAARGGDKVESENAENPWRRDDSPQPNR